MSHYAKVENGVVTSVIVADHDVIDSGLFGTGWVQTSYNTRAGVHYGPDGLPDGKPAFRKNYAGIGYTFDPELDAFVPPKPGDSWTLNSATCQWQAPEIDLMDELAAVPVQENE